MISRRWWFFVGVALIFFVPPLAQHGFTLETWSRVISSTLANAWPKHLTPIQPYLHAFVVLLLIAVFLKPLRFMRTFNGYVAVSYLAFAILQNTAHTPRFGYALVSSNFLWFCLVGTAWACEALCPAADYSTPHLRCWHAWAIPLAFLAFWFPLEPWAFHPKYLLWSYAPIAFCLMTPVYLCVHTAFHPYASPLVLRVTGWVGTLIGCINMFFAFNRGNVYGGVMHIPLLLTSMLALALAARQKPSGRPQEPLGYAPGHAR